MKLVINTGRPVAVVARELGVKEQTLGRWVNLFKSRQDAGDGALSETERAELARLRKANSELKTDRAFLKTSGGRLRGYVHGYLGMRDTDLPTPVAEFVPGTAVINYPTDFAPVPEIDLRCLTLRGEQLTRVLVAHHCPDLGS